MCIIWISQMLGCALMMDWLVYTTRARREHFIVLFFSHYSLDLLLTVIGHWAAWGLNGITLLLSWTIIVMFWLLLFFKKKLYKFCFSLHRKQLKMKTQTISLSNPSRYNIFDILFLYYCHVAIKRKDLPPPSSQLKISRWKLAGHAR